MSLLTATQITAVTTAILAGGAIVTAVYAIRAFRKQSKEVALLQQQAERDIDERRRAQAAKVYLELGTRAPAEAVRVDPDQPEAEPPLLFIARVINASNLLIYKVGIIWIPAFYSAESMPAIIPAKDLVPGPSRLMPGEVHAFRREHVLESPDSSSHWRSGPGVAAAALIFRDAAGVGWRTDTEGNLIEYPSV